MTHWHSFLCGVFILLTLSCAKPRPVEKPSEFKPLVLQFITTDPNWLMGQSCKQDLGSLVSVIQVIAKGSCYDKISSSANLIFMNCDGSSEITILDVSKGLKRYRRHPVSCDAELKESGWVFFDSSPPGASFKIDNEKQARAPVWTRLAKGQHQVLCENGRDSFMSTDFIAGQDLKVLCSRQNQASQSDTDEELSNEEKAGGILMYVLGGLASIGAILLPFLIF
ncbi:MAG: hypothetical protein KDD48_00605 [Bdellovibrionales bacterium]|nr:hypothetical protein [Bdellovibrionales bacterium]